ncbi:hypothetical protein HI914_06401 [Erysiphe necator]|nr:hypothetical protein HI914_06401 [Erysiphe necator]
MQNEILMTRGQTPRLISNSLPQLLRIPSGLALLELQGALNIPASHDTIEVDNAIDGDCDDPQGVGLKSELNSRSSPKGLLIGRLLFPDYDENDACNTAWMKKVYLYVGSYQKLTGEVTKLPKAIAVVQKKKSNTQERIDVITGNEEMEKTSVQLEIVDIIKYKILFSNRPEPVSNQISKEE